MTENEKDLQIRQLTEKVSNLEEQLALMKKLMFGSKSEKTKNIVIPEAQTSLFGDDSDFFGEHEETAGEEEEKEKVTFFRRKKRAGYKEVALENLEKEERHYYLEEPICDHCHHEMADCGSKKQREEVQLIPARLVCIEHMAHSYECLHCKKTGMNAIKTAPVPQGPIPKSYAGAELLAEVASLKYEQFTPLERQLKVWERLGLPLSSRTLANWMIHPAENLLAPLYRVMKRRLLTEEIMQVDETPYRILARSDGKSGQSIAQNWAFRTTESAEEDIILFHCALGRSREDLRNFIGSYQGTIVCDGFSSYSKIEGVVFANCWVHARRLWVTAYENNKYSKNAAMGLSYCNDLFTLERLWQDYAPQERQKAREQFARPLLDGFYTWLNQVYASPKSSLDAAIQYQFNQREGLYRFLTDGRIPCHNNATENVIRPLTLGRKNWLQSTSEAGGQANAIYLSLIATAKANGLDPKAYLIHIFQRLPNEPFLEKPEILQEFLPWSESVQQSCKKKFVKQAQTA